MEKGEDVDVSSGNQSLDQSFQIKSSRERRLLSLLESLKEIERQEFDFQSHYCLETTRLQEEVVKLERILVCGSNDDLCDSFASSVQEANEGLLSKKKELSSKLRSIMALKQKLDAVPSEAELLQYELRFSELNNQIQKKHGQTRKLYDTYNALMEIKELMLKETSLLNSISLQFQDVITRADGRNKLIHSLEGISKGIQQKLEKVDVALQSEEKKCNSIKEKYRLAISEQRRNSSLMRQLQEELSKNERLRAVNGDSHPLKFQRQ